VTAQLRKYPGTEVFCVGSDRQLRGGVTLVAADAAHYAQLCRRAGVPLGSNILINRRGGGKQGEFASLPPIHGALAAGDVPGEILYAGGSVSVLMPSLSAGTYHWFVRTADKEGFLAYARETLDGMPAELTDVTETAAAVRGISRLAMVFIYGFVAMLTLIGLTNVISTITANVRLRSREFAVLQSAGMTRDGLKRMMNLESILCSARSLLIGVPLGGAASWLIHRSVIESTEFPYAFPWLAMAQCVLGVFAVTWVTMRYSVSRLRGRNIVEAIRNNG
jgi:putative ABC transport system permease protein